MRSALTVIEAGPATVRGGQPVDRQVAGEAVEYIDDEIMLVDDRPTPLIEVWGQLLRRAADGGPAAVVHPTGWCRRRVEVLSTAARRACAAVTVLSRAEVLGGSGSSVVELASDMVVTTSDGVFAVPRSARSVVDAVVGHVGGRGPVVVDVPAGVTDGVALGSAIVAALRAQGIAATIAGPHAVRHGVAAQLRAGGIRRNPRRAAILAGVACVMATVGAASAARHPEPPPTEPTALLVEGRVGVVIPAAWMVRRITEGPGSARLQIVSTEDEAVALHVTQSPLPQHQGADQIAATLRTALDAESAEVFTDFRGDAQRAGRWAVTYREHRANYDIDWMVFTDDLLRIAVGCQSPPGRPELVHAACEAAVRSAHAVF